MNIVFRVNATNSIGTGHLHRCIELAKSFRKNKFKIYFICDNINSNIIRRIKNLNFNLYIIKNKNLKKNYEKIDAYKTIKIVHKLKKKINLLVIDSYVLGLNWEKKIQNYVDKIFVVDDLNKKHICDFYLNQNLISRPNQNFLKKNTRNFLGLKYCILKFNKQEKKRVVPKPRKIKKVLIFMGGSDTNNLTLKIIKIIKAYYFRKIDFNIVVGSNNQKHREIKNISKKNKNISIYHDLPNLKKLILNSDIAISSGGTFIWECIFFGLPSLIINQSKNQIYNSKILNNISAIKLYKNSLNDLKNLKFFLETFIMKKNFVVPKKLYDQIDGNGTSRIVKIVKDKLNEN